MTIPFHTILCIFKVVFKQYGARQQDVVKVNSDVGINELVVGADLLNRVNAGKQTETYTIITNDVPDKRAMGEVSWFSDLANSFFHQTRQKMRGNFGLHECVHIASIPYNTVHCEYARRLAKYTGLVL